MRWDWIRWNMILSDGIVSVHGGSDQIGLVSYRIRSDWFKSDRMGSAQLRPKPPAASVWAQKLG